MPSGFINPIGPGPNVSGGAITTPPESLATFTPPTPAQNPPFMFAGDDLQIIMAGDWLPLI